MKLSKYSQFAGVAVAGTLALAACGSDQAVDQSKNAAANVECVKGGGTLKGAGATSQEDAMDAWKVAYEAACDESTVNYDAVGSGGGRSQFVDKAVAFAGSDAALDEKETKDATERCSGSEVVNLPTYISPIAVAFNLKGVDSLNLTPELIADIFNQKITKWNDKKIAAENPDAELPGTKITPVNRSDESGTTENFTAYLKEAAGESWPHEESGNWPIKPAEAAQGSSGVVSAIEGGEGMIGYVDASHVSDKMGQVAVGSKDDAVKYSPEAAVKIVEKSSPRKGNTENDHAVDLDYTGGGKDVYPVVLVSYHVACMEYEKKEDAELVKSFLNYVISEEGQKAAADEAGSAPLPQKTREELKSTVDKISAA